MLDLIDYPIAICGKVPDFYLDRGLPTCKKLAPKIGFFKDWKNGIIDNNGYIVEYKKQVLDLLNPKEVFKELCEIYPNVDDSKIMLICYESTRGGKDKVFCHRNLVASWLRDNGFPCEEFKP